MIIILVWLIVIFLCRKSILAMAIWPLVVAIIFWFLIGGGVVGSIISSNPNWYSTTDWLIGGWEIKSVKFDTRYKGAFFLGTGSIESHDYYYVFTAMNDGKWMKQKFPMESTYIKEVSTPPRALEYTRTVNCAWYKKWLWSIDNFLPMITLYTLEVPVGTIVEEYKP